MPFFLWQALAITVEDFVIASASSLGMKESIWTHITGWLWVTVWLSFSLDWYLGWTYLAGTGQQPADGPLLVQPALEILGPLVGVDILGWIADAKKDRKSTRLNSSHSGESRMPSSA